MKNKIIALLAMLMIGTAASLYAQKPKLMVVPSKRWCVANKFTIPTPNGKEKEDYYKAFAENDELNNVEKALKSIFTEPGREYPLMSLNEVSDSDDDDDALDNAYEGKNGSGGSVESSSFEDLIAKMNNAPDIYLKVGWNESKVGLRKIVEYSIDAVDTYSNKSVATVEGTSEAVSAATPTSIIIKQGVKDKFDEFENKLINHFRDLQQNGREITIRFAVSSNASDIAFCNDVNGESLSTHINNWLANNTVAHRYNSKTNTDKRLVFDQVRIPFKKADGSNNNAHNFTEGLCKHLNSMGISTHNIQQGLGRSRVVLGE
ncbi:MAG: DUF6175 family protein [Candidatus Amulumruptor caecigallinarius]|nr:DUF6175 family protein [Candidatus Amulumruptor caecigallinarius]